MAPHEAGSPHTPALLPRACPGALHPMLAVMTPHSLLSLANPRTGPHPPRDTAPRGQLSTAPPTAGPWEPPYLEHLAVMFTGSQGFLQLHVLVLGAGEAGAAPGQGLRQGLHLVPQEALTLFHLGQGPAQPLHRQLQSACLPLAVRHLGEDGLDSPGVPRPSLPPLSRPLSQTHLVPRRSHGCHTLPTAAWPEKHCQLSTLFQGAINPAAPDPGVFPLLWRRKGTTLTVFVYLA